MKHVSCLLILLSAIVVCGCSSEAWDEMPDRAQRFVSQYFPGVEASSTSVGADGQYTVTLRNSATIVFTELGVWLSIDGNGTTLPDNLLYNELPTALYSYLQEMEVTADGVYTLRRDDTTYYVGMLDSSVAYDIATGKVYYPAATQNQSAR